MPNTSLTATLELPLIFFDLSSHLLRLYDAHSSPALKGASEGLWGFLVMFNKIDFEQEKKSKIITPTERTRRDEDSIISEKRYISCGEALESICEKDPEFLQKELSKLFPHLAT